MMMQMTKTARKTLEQNGAESIDRARDLWWLGLRDVEKESYEAKGGNFAADESHYRRGFEAGLQSKNPASSGSDAMPSVGSSGNGADSADEHQHEAFRHGYERGCAHRDQLKNRQQ